MTEFALSLKIETVGEREALAALDSLDRKGRKIVDDAAGALGKSMGAVAVAYETGGKRSREALEQIADGHRKAIRESERQEVAVDRLRTRQSNAALSAARGLEQIARTGNLASSSLDGVLAQTSQIAFAFGATGAIVGAIAVATNAIVQMFKRAAIEAKKLAADLAAEFARIAHMDVVSQGQAAQLLYSGDANAVDPMLANSIPELRRQRDAAERRSRQTTIRGGPGGVERVLSEDAKAAAEELKKLNAELSRRNDLLTSILGTNGRGGSLERAAAAQAASDLPKFVTADQKAAAKAAKAGQRAEDAEADATLRFLLQQANDQARAAKQAYNAALDQTAAEIEAEEGPIRRLAKTMREQLGSVLGAGIAAGFEEAFRADGFQNPIAAFASAVLGGLGSFMETLGAQMIVVGFSLEALADALLSLNGPAAIAAGVALVAAGAGLKAIAGSFGGGNRGGGSVSASGSGASPSFLTFGVAAQSSPPTTSMSAPAGRQAVTFNIFGPDDPKAQRAIADAWNRANGRGLVSL